MDPNEIYATLNAAYFSETPHEKELIDDLPVLLAGVKLALDCGASLGQYTRAISKSIADGTIHAIEADPVRHAELSRNGEVWSAETGNAIQVHHAAVTDQPGTTIFHITNSDVSGRLTPHHTEQSLDWTRVSVPAVTIDTLFPTATPDFIKIDVEGAELAVIKGAQGVFTRGMPTVLVELHSFARTSTEEIFTTMTGHGYTPVPFHGSTAFVKNPAIRRTLLLRDLRSPRRVASRLRRAVRGKVSAW